MTHSTPNGQTDFSAKDAEDYEEDPHTDEPSWKELPITEVVAETPKAILVGVEEKIPDTGEIIVTQHWFPLSQVHKIVKPCAANNYKGSIRAEFWLIRKKGLA